MARDVRPCVLCGAQREKNWIAAQMIGLRDAEYRGNAGPQVLHQVERVYVKKIGVILIA